MEENRFERGALAVRCGMYGPQAWIYFGSQSECQRALHDRNREYMGGRYVELYCK